MSQALTDQAARRKRPPLGCLLPFLGLFFFAGLAVVYFFSVQPLLLAYEARSWQAVPCTILASEVGTHRGSKGSKTYSIDIKYRYEIQNQTYEGDDYNFFTGSSSGYDSKAAIVEKYPPGSAQTCYVNPRDPREAVLYRDFDADYLFGFFGLLFVGVALGVGYLLLRRPPPRPAGAPQGMTKVYARASGPAPGSTVLKPSTTPGCRVAIALAVCLFWNGIVSVFLVGGGDGCVYLFMIPFVLVGLALFAWVGYSLLALFNPVPVLTVSRAAVPLGQAFDLDWRFDGQVGRLRTLRISLEGREEASYRRGTRTVTDKSVFTTLLLHGDAVQASGRLRVEVPRGTMHSFEAKNNKIVWTLKIHGDIARWPDVEEEFPFAILPAEAKG